MFAFFQQLGAKGVCFNIEEIEGVNRVSSLGYDGSLADIEAFFLRYFNLVESTNHSHWVREYDHTLRRLFSSTVKNAMVKPYEILTVDLSGNYATFSPEMLSAKMPDGSQFVLGNVFERTVPFRQALHYRKDWLAAIDNGVSACIQGCPYSDICMGGSPSNKLAENGRLDSMETFFCRASLQAPVHAMATLIAQRVDGQVRSTLIECAGMPASQKLSLAKY